MRHDEVSRLTNIDYTVSADITLKYDALNRLTNINELRSPTIARAMPSKNERWERLLGYERSWKWSKARLLLTQHPNAQPASWRCPG